jgi:hypothetical protein
MFFGLLAIAFRFFYFPGKVVTNPQVAQLMPECQFFTLVSNSKSGPVNSGKQPILIIFLRANCLLILAQLIPESMAQLIPE